MYGDFPAKNTRSTMYIPMNGWFWPTLNICIHCVACTHRSASLRQLRNTHTHTHIHTHKHTHTEQSTWCGVVSYTHHTHIIHTHRAIDKVWCCFLHTSYTHHTHTHTHRAIDKVWCCFLHTSYTHHTHIIHTPYTHHTQHMHASRCMYAQVSQPEAALKHTHTHTESNRHGVVLYQTHIIHNICIHRVACTHRSASLRQLRNTHTHTYTHRESNRQGVVLYHTHLIHTSYTHHTHITHSICMHRVACTHRSASLRQLRSTHTHTHTHTQTNTHTHTEQSTMYGVVSYTYHTQHMHASRCMHAQVSQPEAAAEHSH